MTSPSPTRSSAAPMKRRHSPLAALCPAHPSTGPSPKHDSPAGQSPSVAHGVSAVEHVRGTTGVARVRSFSTRIAETLTRTWVRLACLSFQPATRRPAKPVGSPPFTFFVILTVTSSDGVEPCMRFFTLRRAVRPPFTAVASFDGGGGRTRQRGFPAPAGLGGSGTVDVKALALIFATGSASGQQSIVSWPASDGWCARTQRSPAPPPKPLTHTSAIVAGTGFALAFFESTAPRP